MSNVFAGSDGSFLSAWQARKRQNHAYGSFVMAHGDTIVSGTTDEDGKSESVWYHGIDEEVLPEGVELTGVIVTL